jgi:hypothetical protein
MHTPGPWYGQNAAGDHQGLVYAEGTGKDVAVTYDTKDAALVSAAPELLAACKEALTLLRWISCDSEEFFTNKDGKDAVNDVTIPHLMEAITKAEGD